MNRTIRVALAVAAGILVGVGIAYASSSSSHRRPVAVSLARRFSVFAHQAHKAKHAAHAAEVGEQSLPSQVAESFSDGARAEQNHEPVAAEAVYEQPDSGSSFGFWIVPGHSGACVVWQTTAVTPSAHANCLGLAAVEKNGMTEISSADGPELVFGFLPNGARSVTVTNTDGSTASGSVVNNAYLVVDTNGGAQSLTVDNGATETTRQIAG
jgi:hypothetical protein